MNPRKLVRTAAIGALIIVALGGIGSALGGRGSSHDSPTAIGDYGVGEGDDSVMAAIDQALGRESKPTANTTNTTNEKAVPPMAPETLANRSADAQSSAGGASSSSIAPVPPGGATGDTSAYSALDDRKIVQTAQLKLQVKDVGSSFEDVGRIASSAGGFVASSSFALQGEQQVAAVSIRVPADRYQDVLRQLRGVGALKIDSETSNSSDVTGEYTDLTARLNTLQATQTQLLTLLGSARTINEILQVQDRLNSVQTQIEQAKGRLALLDKLSDLATISVSLRPVVAPVQTPGTGFSFSAEVSEAWDASLDFLGGIAGGLITVLVFAWWLPLVGIPAYVLGTRYLRNRPRPISAVD